MTWGLGVGAALLVVLSFSAQARENSELEAICEQFNSLGDLDVLRPQIRRDMRRMRQLVDQYDGRSDLRRIEPIAERLRNNLNRVNQIIDPKYSQPDYAQVRNWRLGPKLLWLGELPRLYWKIRAARVTRVYNWTNRHEESLEHASLEVSPYKILAHLKRPASISELCQFEQTIMVTIHFDVEHGARKKTLRRNLLTQYLREQ